MKGLTNDEKRMVYEDLCLRPLGKNGDDDHQKAWSKFVDLEHGAKNDVFDADALRVAEEGKGSPLSLDEGKAACVKLIDCHD